MISLVFVKVPKFCLFLLGVRGAHVQYKTLKLIKENQVVVINFSSHISHVTQPLDVSGFSFYKATVLQVFHLESCCKKVLDVIDMAGIPCDAYSKYHNDSNVVSRFYRTSVWEESICGFYPDATEKYSSSSSNYRSATVEDLIQPYSRCTRSLLRETNVKGSGTIKIRTVSRAFLR